MKMPEINRLLVSVDANTIIHFHKAGFTEEPGQILNGIMDEFVLNEVKRWAPDTNSAILEKRIMSSWLKIIKREDLKLSQKHIYDNSYNNNRLLFDPKDWGEARAIALGHAMGAIALLTDDTKKSGPRDYILKGVIEAIDTIAYWEVLLMLFIVNLIDGKTLVVLFEQIKEKGYTAPPKIQFRSIMESSVKRLKLERWFQDWLLRCEINQTNLDKKLEVI